MSEKEYAIFGRTFDESESILAERYLTECFRDTWSEIGIDHGDDSPAWRESFNTWTDSLCKAGDINDSAYQDLCPIGEEFD